MLTIYQSHLTEQLFDALSQVIQRRPAGMSVLCTELVLVQNPDMAQWLKMELASNDRSCGIAANIDFPLPSAFLWRLFSCLFVDELPQDSPFTKDKLRWQLMALLPTFAKDNEHFAWAHSYLSDDSPGNDDIGSKSAQQIQDEQQFRLYQLCGQISDLFDQYLMYRPDWIEAWEQEEINPDLPDDQHWQPILWKSLSDTISDRAKTDLHRGRLLRLAIDKLNDHYHSGTSLDLRALPTRISVFGISSMPEQSLLLLNALAKHIDIHWFQMNPCREFWLDIIDPKTKAKLAADKKYIHLDDLEEDRYFLVGNPLLASTGTLGREHLSLMYEQLEGDLIENEQDLDYPTIGALGVLQNEVLNLHNRGQFETLSAHQLSSNDGKIVLNAQALSNIEFHVNYSAMREVEVLKDSLLSLFDHDPSLTPNDVLVMMPDGGVYAPYINAVFAFKNGEQNFPYSINDLSVVQESPLMDSLLALFNLPESRMSVSEVIGILEVPAVLKRFDIELEELDLIKHWLHEVGINWGRDAVHRLSLGLVAFEENSWLFGIKRMLTGYAMHPEQGLFDDSLPYLEIEGGRSIALGKLLMFIDSLDIYLPLMQESRSSEDWASFMAQLLNQFYLCDGDEQILLQKASSLVADMAQHCQLIDFDEPISRLIVRDYLSQSLSKAQSSKRFRAGVINFSTLMPMRSIPFKVICLLGMNEGEFPRQTQNVSFDLMRHQRRRGDRSGRLDDRYLFLEALLSCRQHLHISWVGRDIRNDSVLPPSILVAELMDYMQEAWILEEDFVVNEQDGSIEDISPEQCAKKLIEQLTTQHPLQAFNTQYFTQNSGFISYSKLWLQSLNKQNLTDFSDCLLPLTEDEQQSQIELSQLEAVFINPCQAFMQRRLGIYLDTQQSQFSDSEPFDSNALQKWKIKESLYELLKNQGSIDHFNEIQLHQGDLPVGLAGQGVLNACNQDANAIITAVPQHLLHQELQQELRLDLAGTLITGTLPQAQQGQIAYIKIGSAKAKDKMRTWLRHLLYCAACLPVNSLLIDSKRVLDFAPIGSDRAKQLLSDYLQHYFTALTRPVPFFINVAQHHASGKCDKEALLTKWRDPWNPHACDGDNAYISRCYPELEPVIEDFYAWYERIYQAMQDSESNNLTHKQYGL